MPLAQKLCWFCAKWVTEYIGGNSLGEMVHSSFLYNSLELASGLQQDQTPQGILERNNRCIICEKCLATHSAKMTGLDKCYIAQQNAWLEEQREEICDDDVMPGQGLIRHLPFGCWLSGRPDEGIKSRIRSHSLVSLFEFGLRFEGSVTLASLGLKRLQSRTPTDDSVREVESIPPEFVQNIMDAYRANEPSLIMGIAHMRAEIFDVSLMFCKI